MSKCVVLGVTGGIAAYKAAELTSMLIKAGVSVQVVMTTHATRFIAPLTFSTLTGNQVVHDMFAEPTKWDVEHIALAKRADVFAIVPATANVIGKIANGIADDFLTTTIMATKAPVIIAPAMNTNMYENSVVQENIAKLKEKGYSFIAPAGGRLACGDVGVGKLAPVEKIFKQIMDTLYPVNDLMGKTVMVTAGPTREQIDPVRYITNHSSGKMGYAIAQAALDRGAKVILVSGPVNISAPRGAEKIDVISTKDMHEAVMGNLDRADVIIKSAAPSDFRVENVSEQKIKRNGNMTVTFTENADIAADVGRNKGDKVLVVFAAESEKLIEHAQKKLKSKNADLIVANDITLPGAGFNSPDNEATIIGHDFMENLPLMSKEKMANKILDAVSNILQSR